MSGKPRLTLSVLSGAFPVCRLHADEKVPAWADQSGILLHHPYRQQQF
jgi:hypothetical protein